MGEAVFILMSDCSLLSRTLKLAVAALLAIALLTACDQPPADTIRFGLSANPVTLDPRYATDAASTRVNRLLYARLVDFDDHFQPVASLATWQRLGPLHYRFSLHPDRAPFHNGQTLTSHDVVATYASILDKTTASPHRASMNIIQRMETPDEEHIDFYLHKPDSLFPGRLVIGVLPRSLLATGHKFGQQPLGSGPFRFVAWPQAEQLQIARIDDQQVFEFLRIRKPDVRVLKLLRGEIDLIQGDMPPELLAWLADRSDVRVGQRDGTTFAYIGFNLQDPTMRDLRVRQAIAHAIDRKAIIQYIWANSARPANGILTPDHWAGAPELKGVAYDLQRAQALLAQAGYDRKNPLHVVYKTSTNAVRLRIATIFQSQLARAGIKVEIRSYDWGTFYADIKAGNFQMYSLAWVGIKLPDIFRYVFHSESVPPQGANRGRFKNQRADQFIEAAEVQTTLAEQAHYYRQLQHLVLKELPYVALWYEDQIFVTRKSLQGYSVTRDGNYDGLLNVTRAPRP